MRPWTLPRTKPGPAPSPAPRLKDIPGDPWNTSGLDTTVPDPWDDHGDHLLTRKD